MDGLIDDGKLQDIPLDERQRHRQQVFYRVQIEGIEL
jgi:hypothetical protein